CVYKAYLSTTAICIKTIEKIESKWSPLFKDFLSRKGAKKKFDLKWFKNKFPDKIEDEIEYFMLFLYVIGYFKIASDNSDFKLKIYEIPIIYSNPYKVN
ncbi:MAG: hypothetical protein D3906_07700, partial [Candidatus Electrothrix sp. AUS1_2]|nr:hypothetical protein [Candidatus Electrothrix sp. AUS1_2]